MVPIVRAPNGRSLRSTFEALRFYYRTNYPRVVHFAITNACDSQCATCRFWREDERRYVSLEDACTAMDFLHEHGVRLLSVTGGEPFLHPDLPELCKHARKRGMLVSYIPTNGAHVTEDVAKDLVEAGVNIVGVSVDPLFRTDGHRTRAVDPGTVARARTTLEGAGMKTYAGVLITRHMLPISRCLETVKGLGFKRVVFSYPQTSERASYLASGEHEMLDLDAPYVEEVVRGIMGAKGRYSIYNPDGTLQDLVRFYRGDRQRFPCLGGSRVYFLDWDLQLHRCFTDPNGLGDILAMEDLPCTDSACTACTQQAFREMSYLLTAIDRFQQVRDSLKGVKTEMGSPASNGGGFAGDVVALFQLLTGGFV